MTCREQEGKKIINRDHTMIPLVGKPYNALNDVII